MTKVGLKACTSAEISRTIRELLQGKRAHGGLKNHECRQLLERLQEQGWFRLPPVRRLQIAGQTPVADLNPYNLLGMK
jgi:hypothetical protein